MSTQLLTGLANLLKSAWTATINWASTPDETGKTPFEKFVDEAKNRALAIGRELSLERMKILVSYEEHSYETLSFGEMLAKIRSSCSLKPGERVCILKTQRDIVIFDALVCDANDEILFSPVHPWCRFIVANPDADLIGKFGDKPMLVLK